MTSDPNQGIGSQIGQARFINFKKSRHSGQSSLAENSVAVESDKKAGMTTF
jgi:hypothetical protein